MSRLRSLSDETFRSLRHRNFRLFFGGQAMSQIGTWISQITLMLLVLHITDSGLALGVLTACQYLPVLLLGVWAGVIADRHDKRRVLLIAQSVGMLQSLALGALVFIGEPPLPLLYLMALIGGTATAFDNPARRAFVVELVPDEDMHNAVGLNSAAMTGSRIVGPALAGLLVSTVGHAWCFTLDGISYLFVLAGLISMRTAELRPAPVVPREKGQILSGIKYVRNSPELWIAMMIMVVVGMLTFNFQVVLPVLVHETFDASDTTFTLLYSVLSVGSLLGALFTARRTTVRVHDVIIGAAVMGASAIALGAAPNIPAAYAGGMVLGFASMMYMTAVTSLLQLRAEPTMRGRVLSLQTVVFIGSTPIGGPLLGAVCEFVSPRAGLFLGGAAALAVVLWAHFADHHRVRAGGGVPEGSGRPGDLNPAELSG